MLWVTNLKLKGPNFRQILQIQLDPLKLSAEIPTRFYKEMTQNRHAKTLGESDSKMLNISEVWRIFVFKDVSYREVAGLSDDP